MSPSFLLDEKWAEVPNTNERVAVHANPLCLVSMLAVRRRVAHADLAAQVRIAQAHTTYLHSMNDY